MDNINGQIRESIVVHGRGTKCMEKAFLNGRMEGTHNFKINNIS